MIESYFQSIYESLTHEDIPFTRQSQVLFLNRGQQIGHSKHQEHVKLFKAFFEIEENLQRQEDETNNIEINLNNSHLHY